MMIIKKETEERKRKYLFNFSVFVPSLRDERQNRRMNESRNPKIWTCKIVIKTTHSFIVVVVAVLSLLLSCTNKKSTIFSWKCNFLDGGPRHGHEHNLGFFRNHFGRKVSHDSAKNGVYRCDCDLSASEKQLEWFNVLHQVHNLQVPFERTSSNGNVEQNVHYSKEEFY